VWVARRKEGEEAGKALTRAALAEAGAADIEGDGVEPGGEGRVAAKSGEGGDGADQGILRGVIRLGGIVEQGEGEPLDAGPVGGDEFFEGARVAGLALSD